MDSEDVSSVAELPTLIQSFMGETLSSLMATTTARSANMFPPTTTPTHPPPIRRHIFILKNNYSFWSQSPLLWHADLTLSFSFQPAKRSCEKQQLLFGKIALSANSFFCKFWSEGGDVDLIKIFYQIRYQFNFI